MCFGKNYTFSSSDITSTANPTMMAVVNKLVLGNMTEKYYKIFWHFPDNIYHNTIYIHNTVYYIIYTVYYYSAMKIMLKDTKHDTTWRLFVSVQTPWSQRGSCSLVHLQPVQAQRTPVINICHSQHREFVYELHCCTCGLCFCSLSQISTHTCFAFVPSILTLFSAFFPSCVVQFGVNTTLFFHPWPDACSSISCYCQDCNMISLLLF